MITKQVI